jgi:hypothetical protein
MRQFLLGGFLSGAFLMLLAAHGSACINDREVANSEREFKSHYQSQPTIQSPQPDNQLLAYGATGLGSFMLIGSVVVTLKKTR